MRDDELFHYGTLGQKWGIRRYQNPDGSLTDEGRARYRTDKALNNGGRALTNTSVGQRLAVNMNKGYKTDKKEIKNLYKSKKSQISTDETLGKEQKKTKLSNLKSDYKKTLGEARTSAAQANYSWQSDAANAKIQTQSVGKAFVKSFLVGGYAAKKYDEVSADTKNRGTAALHSVLHMIGNNVTYGALGIGEYAYGKYSVSADKKRSVSKER
jgi:hypothetical protein